jgi:hypothetical protein
MFVCLNTPLTLRATLHISMQLSCLLTPSSAGILRSPFAFDCFLLLAY